ncbi:hypothetical protein GCM10023080_039770 [Streptomyces pseudoechinosporeus]
MAKVVLRDRAVTAWLALARADDLRVITSAATLVEVVHPRISRPALEWTLSRLVVEPVTEPIAGCAAAGGRQGLAGRGRYRLRRRVEETEPWPLGSP